MKRTGFVLLDAMLWLSLMLIVCSMLGVGVGAATRYCSRLMAFNQALDQAHNHLQLAMMGHVTEGVTQYPGPYGSIQYRVEIQPNRTLIVYGR